MDKGLNTSLEALKVLGAVHSGKEVQVWDQFNDEWTMPSRGLPDFMHNTYRVRPEPELIWVNHYPSGRCYMYQTAAEASSLLNKMGSVGVTKVYREVLDG